jgi:ATP-dependent exoDNAse (exonuclease V) alpha subunit
MKPNNYHLKHLSIRVPWHQNKWNGTVCDCPKLNDACLCLPNIAESRDDERETANAGKSIENLTQLDWPSCISERGSFMYPKDLSRTVSHPYVKNDTPSHRHFLPTDLHLPAWSAPAVAFRWMRKENMDAFAEEFDLNIDKDNEPELPFNTGWVQARENQEPLLDCFFDQVQPHESLVFFYVKEMPAVEDSRKIIIGVGRVTSIGKSTEYEYSAKGSLRSILWERPVKHSIRPGYKDGFLLPYHELLAYYEDHPDLKLSDYIAFAPEARFEEFSFGSEHVSHDSAIASLLSCLGALQKLKGIIEGPWDSCISWIDVELGKLWEKRGAFPGLGSALHAFGLNPANLIANEVTNKIAKDDNPWDYIEKVFKSPAKFLSPKYAVNIDLTIKDAWNSLPGARKEYLHLLSRFDLSKDQAKMAYNNLKWDTNKILENPYLLFEYSRETAFPIGLLTIDKGAFPETVIRESFPLPPEKKITTPVDKRRIRAFIIKILDSESLLGNTLYPKDELLAKFSQLQVQPACPVTPDLLAVTEKYFDKVISVIESIDNQPVYQLNKYVAVGEIIRAEITNRISKKRIKIDADWSKLLAACLDSKVNDAYEKKARREKTAALKELAEAPISVLLGAAGTGKTTLLTVLCSHEDIADEGILLLAPTGKARVKMEETGKKISLEAFTIAQYLSKSKRYDGALQQYKLQDAPPDDSYKTVIIDEASMLTEEMLAAIFQSLTKVKRYILVGDPFQLPPIGAGRPFVDIIRKLKPVNFENSFPKVVNSYCELTIHRRQVIKDKADTRHDLVFADHFRQQSDDDDDEIFEIVKKKSLPNIEFVEWNSYEEFNKSLYEVLMKELPLNNDAIINSFDISLGAVKGEKYISFTLGSALKVENWQILSPIKGTACGVFAINREVHNKFREATINRAKSVYRSIPAPVGIEEIVIGDKVINVRNHWRDKYQKVTEKGYLANGEIGIVIGPYKKTCYRPRLPINAEFSSQPGYTFGFWGNEFSDEFRKDLELAYALTVHKAQGSQFKKVILVLPKNAFNISRELIYTALTRQQQKVIILHQGKIREILKHNKTLSSEIARRLTNLFEVPEPINYNGSIYEKRFFK